MRITLTRNELKASLLTAAKDDEKRSFLIGVSIERSQDGLHVLLVSTNGHVLSVINSSMQKHEVAEEGAFDPFTLARKHIKTALMSGDEKYDIECYKDRLSGSGRVITMIGEDSRIQVMMPEVEGTFPKWNLIVPRTTSGEPGWYSARYVHLLERFGERLERSFSFHYNGARSSAVAKYDNKALVVIMPVETEQGELVPPEWLGGAAK